MRSKLLLIPFVNKNYSSYSNRKGEGKKKTQSRDFKIPKEHVLLIWKNSRFIAPAAPTRQGYSSAQWFQLKAQITNQCSWA